MGYYGQVIGLTGKIASGKSTVAQILQKKGFYLVDVDSLGHKALKKEKEIIKETFGISILDSRGEVNRRKLGNLVFSNPALLSKLEAIIHPIIQEQVKEILQKNSGKNILLDSALLYQMKLDSFCSRVIVVETFLPFRLYRLCLIKKIPFLYALKILWNQKKLVPKNPKNISINNTGSKHTLSHAINQLNLY